MLRHDSTEQTCFDQTLYERLIEPDQFLKRLKAAIDFRIIERLCRGCCVSFCPLGWIFEAPL